MSVAVPVFVVCAACGIAGHVAILRSVIGGPSHAVPSGVRRPNRAIEIIWAAIPAIALVFLLIVTWAHVRENEALRSGVILNGSVPR